MACTGLVAALLAPAGEARAGGFEIPDHGARAVGRAGAYAVGAADLTALHYNPGALARLGGSRALYHHNLVFHRTSFERAPLSSAWGPDAGARFARVEDGERLFPRNLFAVVASDFGLDDWTFAAGVYGPHAVGRHDYPEYGPQAFMLTDMEVVVPYYSIAAAWQVPRKFGVGVTLQYVDLVRLDYGMVVDARVDDALDPVPDAESTQLAARLELSDRTAATALVGVWARPHRALELGLGGRVIPVALRAEGRMSTDKPTLVTDDVAVEMPLTLPIQLRGGARYVHERLGRERFDVELDLHWENWSVVEDYHVRMDGRISGQEVDDLKIEKNWRDTLAVRLGGDVHVIDGHLSLRAGSFWESGASPNELSHLDFPSFMRGGLAAGVSGTHRNVTLTIGYMHIFQEDREVTESAARVFQQRPLAPCPEACAGLSGVPANTGLFRSSYDVLSVGVDVVLGAFARGT